VSPTAPYDAGELNVTMFFHDRTPFKDLKWRVHIWVPEKKDYFGAVLFLPGLDGNIPALAYTQTLSRIASHGYIVLGFTNLLTIPIPTEHLAKYMRENVEWVSKDLNSLLDSKKLLARVDVNSISLMGHSAGCKIITKVFEDGCGSLSALLLINPVDGLDPWGLVPSYVIHDGKKVNFTTPTLVMASGLGANSGHNGSKFFPACEPYNLSSHHFYPALNCPKWFINATDFGHADWIDPEFYKAIQLTKFCATNDHGPLQEYRNFISGATVSFLNGVFQQQCSDLKYIEDPQLIPKGINTVLTSELSCSSSGCPKGSCVDHS
jgi:pimeloyl-ACP methyl ester carboxylesterase